MTYLTFIGNARPFLAIRKHYVLRAMFIYDFLRCELQVENEAGLLNAYNTGILMQVKIIGRCLLSITFTRPSIE